MKQILGTTVALAVLAIFISSAHAVIKIETATVQNGVVFIKGNGAVKGAQISWEGLAVTTANRTNGGFSFFGVLPDDCVGALSDGGTPQDVQVLNCTPVSAGAGVPKTGQTTSFATGDDGDLEKGVALPNPRFTDNSNGTITDNLTGLIWLKNANCSASTRTWQGALDFVAGINNATNSCGDTSNAGFHQSDWRLPNVRELQSLVDYGQYLTTLSLPSGHPFTNFLAGSYWSSTTQAGNTFNAWYVVFINGGVGASDKTDDGRLVTAVRGGS